MATAKVDPEALDMFAGVLEQYADALEDETRRVISAFESICDFWEDQRRTAFEEDFNEFMPLLQNFRQNNIEAAAAHLRALAERAREYLGN